MESVKHHRFHLWFPDFFKLPKIINRSRIDRLKAVEVRGIILLHDRYQRRFVYVVETIFSGAVIVLIPTSKPSLETSRSIA